MEARHTLALGEAISATHLAGRLHAAQAVVAADVEAERGAGHVGPGQVADFDRGCVARVQPARFGAMGIEDAGRDHLNITGGY